YQGSVMQKLGSRKGELVQMAPLGETRMRVEFRIPSRGLFGYRSEFLTDTHGEGILNTIFDGYDEWRGEISGRSTGSLISFETGVAVAYGIFNAQARGSMLISPAEKVYGGMVVGYSPSGEDITVNVCKTKHLSNTRASGSDDALRLIPVSKFSLEESLEFLAQDELLEVTPQSLRIRKRILDHALRMKSLKGKQS
ncbi:MAG: translational GTPase TypA, partial [Ruthenibacterium sp.]